MQTQDLLKDYRYEDTKRAKITDRFMSIAPQYKGDGAIAISRNVDEQRFDYNDDNGSYMGSSSVAFQDINLTNLANKQKINMYRDIMRYPEVENVVNNIVADAIVFDDKKEFVKLNLDDTDFSPHIKNIILEEFENVLRLYRSKVNGQRHFKRYYVDSKIFFHKVIDPDHPELGIQEMRELDPRMINLHRENLYAQDQNGHDVWVGHNDFFVYQQPIVNNQLGYDYSYASSIGGSQMRIIPFSAITYAHSGQEDCNGQIIGHLHQAIKPAHNLKMLEDAMVIYRVVRAPDRKIFYVDTGKLNGRQSKELMEELKTSHNSKVVYNTVTGQFDNYKNQMLVTDDYWLQRQDGRSTAEIDTLPGASNLNEIDDIKYQKKALYEALKAPLSRMPNENSVMFGDDGGTSRDERMFAKFVDQTTNFYSEIFADPLMTNLILKGIITMDEWNRNRDQLIFKFRRDEYYTEIAEIETLERRYSMLEQVEPYRNQYLSARTIMKKILRYTDEEIEEEFRLIEEEKSNPIFNPPIMVNQYGQPIRADELGTASKEVEQVITGEYDFNIQNQIEQQEISRQELERERERERLEKAKQKSSELNEDVKFTIYK